MTMRAGLVTCLAVSFLIACAGEEMEGGNSGGGGAGGEFARARQTCVDRINAFRASEGKPALGLWNAAAPCVDTQARNDARSGAAHGNFGECGELAQNTCPRWPSVDAVVSECLQQMWNEGPGPFAGHGHYRNMASTQYREVACGFHVMSDGKVWASQNFR